MKESHACCTASKAPAIEPHTSDSEVLRVAFEAPTDGTAAPGITISGHGCNGQVPGTEPAAELVAVPIEYPCRH